jgi:hypothetical protein
MIPEEVIMAKSIVEIREVVDPEAFYTRKELVPVVGTGWANIMEASKPNKKTGAPARLKGELKQMPGKNQKAWYFKGSDVLAWRESVSAGSKTPKVVILLDAENPDADRAELAKLLAGSKFAI